MSDRRVVRRRTKRPRDNLIFRFDKTVFNLAALQHPQIDPVIFHLGPLAVRWYGVAYLLGFLLAYMGLRWLIRRGDLRLTYESLADLLGWMIAGVVVGGRAGWWIFYHRAGGVEPWYEPFAIWHGGMSFHGGLVGVAIVLLVWARMKKMAFWNLADGAALVAPVGLFFGRIANFINAELVGRPTDLPWGVIFPGDSVARHPSQLYEAVLEGILLLSILWAVRTWRRPSEGRLAALFLIGYGAIRFAVEFTRQPDEQMGFVAFAWLTMGQLLSLILLLAGVVTWWARGRIVATRRTAVPGASRPSDTLTA